MHPHVTLEALGTRRLESCGAVRQPVHEGIDTGRENIGDAASLEDGRNVFLADVRTNNKSIKKKMTERAGFRRERRRHRRIRKQRRSESHA